MTPEQMTPEQQQKMAAMQADGTFDLEMELNAILYDVLGVFLEKVNASDAPRRHRLDIMYGALLGKALDLAETNDDREHLAEQLHDWGNLVEANRSDALYVLLDEEKSE